MKRLSAIALVFFILSPAAALAGGYLTLTSSSARLYSENSTGSKLIRVDENIFGKSFDIFNKVGDFYEIDIPDHGPAYVRIADGQFLKNITASNYVLARRMPKSKLTQKALIVNKPGKQMALRTNIKYYDNPMLNGNHLGEISIFEIRFIFAENESAVLVGRTDRLLKNNSGSVLAGWISKDHIVEWNNLIGMEFDKGNYTSRKKCAIGRIYDAEKLIGSKNAEPIFSEGQTDQAMPYYANRFPVLEERNGGKHYKIAYIGNALGKKGAILNSREVESARERIMQVFQNNDVQIAILIDATLGMSRHIENVKTAVKEFLSHYQGKDGLTPSIAVCVYRDYPVENDIFELKCDFTKDSARIRKAIDAIRIITNGKDTGAGKYPEAVFNGIDQAMKGLSWKNASSGEKYILLLGDHGNHEQYDQYPQDKTFSSRKIGQVLKQNATTLFALQVNLTHELARYNRMFERQVLEIKENNQGRGGLKKVYTNSPTAIFSGLQDIVEDFLIIKQALVDIRNADSMLRDRAKRFSEMYKGVFSPKMLARYGINPDVFDAVQICAVGYLSRKNACGADQILEKVLMKKKDIESLKVQMQQLSDSLMFYDPETATEFKMTVFKVVKALTGDQLAPGEDIADFIEKKSGIPINTPFLHTSMSELLDSVRSASYRKKFRRYLQQRLVVLEEVVKERKLSYDPIQDWDDEDQTFLYEESGEHVPYFFSLEQPLPERGQALLKASQKQYAWIPLAYLP